jgi:probable rRNA maturation factor
MEIWIRIDREPPGIDEEKLRRRAERVLGALGFDAAELSVWLCEDEAMTELHGRYLGDYSPTNVMSFAQREGEFGDVAPEVLGDVVISLATAERDAREAGGSLDDEVAYLLVHGILHLVGYDHEGAQAHRSGEMEDKEAELYRLALDEA